MMTPSVNATEIRVQRRITRAIAMNASLDTVLASVARAAARLCHTPMALVTLLDDTGEQLEVVGVFGTPESVRGTCLPVAASLNGLVIASGRSVRSMNVLRDPRSVVQQIPLMSGARGVLFVPLRDQRGPFGTLAVAKRVPWHFSARDEALLSRLADSASIAIQNAKLREQLRRSPAQFGRADRAGSQPQGPAPGPYRVSPREREVLNLLIAGMTCKEIASALSISGRTVQHYLDRLKLRFHQPRLPALVGYVVKHDV
jgi:DNA-binding CsgD family transcriptional regulator